MRPSLWTRHAPLLAASTRYLPARYASTSRTTFTARERAVVFRHIRLAILWSIMGSMAIHLLNQRNDRQEYLEKANVQITRLEKRIKELKEQVQQARAVHMTVASTSTSESPNISSTTTGKLINITIAYVLYSLYHHI
jgi:CII-binding regulator of phage lambda lysogenization HflD